MLGPIEIDVAVVCEQAKVLVHAIWASVHAFEDATPGPDSRRGKLSGATRVSVTVIDSADPENYVESHGRVPIFGAVYDSGDYAVALAKALAAAGYEDLRAEQAKRRADGDVAQLGIGLSCYVEITGAGAESGNPSENATVEVHPDGSATSLRSCGKRPSASWRPSPRRRGPHVLLRRVARIASRVKGELDVVHVIVGDTSPPADGRSVGGLRELTADLGARWHEIEDDDPARAFVSFAHGPRAGRTKPAATTSFSSAPAA